MLSFGKLGHSMPPKQLNVRFVLRYIGLFAAYYATAKVGVSHHAVNNFATLIWAPTGIALASLTIFGIELWPAIAIAALLVNVSIGASLFVAVGVAVGHTLEAVIGATLLRQYGFDPSFGKVKDVLLFVFIGVMFSTLFNATIGVYTLFFAGVAGAGVIKATWLAWWMGDVASNFIVAPFLFIWSTVDLRGKSNRQFARDVLLFILPVAICLTVFSLSDFSAESTVRPGMVIPLFLLFSLFCDQLCALSAVFVLAISSLFVTALGWGPVAFHAMSISHDIVLVQGYFCALALGNLVVSTVMRERRDYGHNLEQVNLKLAHAEKEIRGKNAQLLLAHKAKDEFISNLSHELRNPLNIISGCVQMLKSTSRTQDEFKLALLAIERSAETQLHLVEDLLDMSRLITGKFSIEPRRCNFREIINNAYRSVEYSAQAKRVELKLDVELADPYIVCDGVRMQQVLWNLLSNAVKFTKSGEFVNLKVRRDEAELLIEVKDNGIGISESQLPHVFERLWQASDASISGRGGLGLGLSIVKDLVEGHGGVVEAESRGAGKGTTFRVKLPIRPPQMKIVAESASRPLH